MRRYIPAAAAAVLLFSVPAEAQEVNRLPFADGTYVTDQALCRMSVSQMLARYRDRVGLMVRNIEGRMVGGYESQCEVQSVAVAGNTITFQAKCSGEGTTWLRDETWVRVDARSFRIDDRTYRGCGRLIR